MENDDLIKQAEELARWLDEQENNSFIEGNEELSDWQGKQANTIRQLIAKVKEREGWVLVPEDLIRFLHGEGAFHGVHFGDKPLEERGDFWWRKYLPRAKP